MDSTVEKLPPNILLFPFPAHSHIHFLLNLAELLCCRGGLHVTFLVADQTHRHLLNDTAVRSRFNRYSGFRFQNLRDGLPVRDSQGSLDKTMEFGSSFLKVAKQRFKEVLISLSSSSDWQKAEEDSDHVAGKSSIACIIVDSMMASFAVDAAGEAGIPIMCNYNACPSDFWTVLCVPKLIEAGEIPFQGDDLDVPIANVPGLEGLLRRRDLSSFLRVEDLSDKNAQFMINGVSQARRTRMILNTFEELEGPALAQMRSLCPGIYTVGPLHEHLKTRFTSMIPPNNLKKENTGCIAWLDAQPLRSVIYVSFGSIIVMSNDQIMELWHGLKNSGKRFLWALPNVADKEWRNKIPPELFEDSSRKGYIVAWAPQDDVLDHKAVGGFLTHCGWNSTLESIVAGVPMICLPYYGDQQCISRLIAEVWKIGLDMKDTCDRVIIQKMIKELMDTRREEFTQSADQIAKLAKNAVSEGGSSYINLDRLIEDIRSLDTD
ncbi:7-deoxyloganetic acid glucosyl transferase-like [Rhododendron vialii]|uniref:7-deoxyloganetic acid glucosyl transferase-like n=1 Tax=Rhododendron vialii TaxID=182163 RepID=UPI00265F7224|nr:7-deoxyloganetic acid glucosyl transferase-like [Rhododendron vialii]